MSDSGVFFSLNWVMAPLLWAKWARAVEGCVAGLPASLSGTRGAGAGRGGTGPAASALQRLCLPSRELVVNRLTSCCRRSANVSYKYSKVTSRLPRPRVQLAGGADISR